MRVGRKSGTDPIGLGFRALKGGGVVVGVVVDEGDPRVILSTFLPTAAEGDRLALEPYRIAYEMKRGPDGEASTEAAAAVAEGTNAKASWRQRVWAISSVGCGTRDASRSLRRCSSIAPVGSPTLAYSLSWPDHVPIAEGLAVRDALRFACGRCRVEVAEIDEKSLHEVASKQLRLSPHDIDIRLKSLGATSDRPWRREQKLACLSAWITVAAPL
jgi:hypothetical protein